VAGRAIADGTTALMLRSGSQAVWLGCARLEGLMLRSIAAPFALRCVSKHEAVASGSFYKRRPILRDASMQVDGLAWMLLRMRAA